MNTIFTNRFAMKLYSCRQTAEQCRCYTVLVLITSPASVRTHSFITPYNIVHCFEKNNYFLLDLQYGMRVTNFLRDDLCGVHALLVGVFSIKAEGHSIADNNALELLLEDSVLCLYNAEESASVVRRRESV